MIVIIFFLMRLLSVHMRKQGDYYKTANSLLEKILKQDFADLKMTRES